MTHVELANQRRYLVVDDVRATHQALLSGQALDELTGRPPAARPVPSGTVRRVLPPGVARAVQLSPVVGTGGVFALAGSASGAFPPPAAWSVDVRVTAPGYETTAVTVAVPPASTFPVDIGMVRLRRRAVWVDGRVVRRTTGAPVGGAVVTVVAPVGLVSIPHALGSDHAAGAAITPLDIGLPGPPLTVGRTAPAGATAVWLESRTGLAVGLVLRVEAGPPAEYADVAALDGPPTPASGWVRLRNPLAHSLRRGSTVRRVSTAPSGPATAWAVDAFAGDQAARVVNPAALAGADVARLEHPDPSRVEHRHVTVATPVTTGADGAFVLGFVSRTPTVRLRVTGVPPAPVETEHVIDFEQPGNRVTFRI